MTTWLATFLLQCLETPEMSSNSWVNNISVVSNNYFHAIIYMHVLTKHIQQFHLVYNSITYYAWVQFSMHTYSVHLALNYIMLFISVMYLTIHKLEFWPMCWHILHTLPIVFQINWMSSFSTQTLHQEYNFVVFISVSKNVAAQVLFKGRKILVPVSLITFPYPTMSWSHTWLAYWHSFL